MHSHHELLVKANNKKEALFKVEEFLDIYKDDVWDWYEVGGRWEGVHKRLPCSVEDAVAAELSEKPSQLPDVLRWKDYPKECESTVRYMFDVRKETLANKFKHLRDETKMFPTMEGFIQCLESGDRRVGMILYLMSCIDKVTFDMYCIDSCFFDVEAMSGEFGEARLKEVANSVDEYWLVTVDLHH